MAMAEGSRLMNVYVVDAQGRVHDVAYDQDAATAKMMAKTLEGGVAALERPAEKKPAKSA